MPVNAIVIPAFNEEEHIGRVLATAMEAKAQGIARHVLVVDDGSSDKTAEIAKRAGAEVLHIEKNIGKGWAAIEGFKWCKAHGIETVVLLDADILNLQVLHLMELLEKIETPIERKLKNGATVMEKPAMVQMATIEGMAKTVLTTLSGQRAIRMQALDFLSKTNNPKGLPEIASKPARRFYETAKGFGLELALNKQFAGRTINFSPTTELLTANAYRKGARPQVRESKRARLILVLREKKAKELCKARAKRNLTK